MEIEEKTTAAEKEGMKIPPKALRFYRLLAMPKKERDEALQTWAKDMAWAVSTFLNGKP